MLQNKLLGKIPWLVVYFAIVAVATVGMFWLRGVVVNQQQKPAAVEDWNEWRNDVKEHDANLGPVERRIPASAEPPALVLMRDHFVACMVAVVVGTALVTGVTMWFLEGALGSAKRRRQHEAQAGESFARLTACATAIRR